MPPNALQLKVKLLVVPLSVETIGFGPGVVLVTEGVSGCVAKSPEKVTVVPGTTFRQAGE